jgi:hypothetical protein
LGLIKGRAEQKVEKGGNPKTEKTRAKTESKNREQKYKAKNQNTEKRRKSKGAGQIGVLA